MTDITPYEDHAPAVQQPAELAASVAPLVEWAHAARAAHQVASSLVKTSFVPEAFRNKPDEATAAILAGSEVGLSPMAALRSFDIIQGTAAPRALTLRAVVQSHGHQMWVEESSETRAIVGGQRRGSANAERSVWTIDRARKLGLTGKKNWQAQPQAMLLARATSECARLIAADAILGLPYSAEEIEDNELQSTTTVQREKRTVQRKPREAAPQPEPELTPEPPLEPEPPVDKGITADQSKKLHAQFRDLGYEKDRAGRLALAAQIVGHPLESSSDLAKHEASALIDVLETALASPDPQGHLEDLTGGAS